MTLECRSLDIFQQPVVQLRRAALRPPTGQHMEASGMCLECLLSTPTITQSWPRADEVPQVLTMFTCLDVALRWTRKSLRG
jgi:hypothetical protein